MGSFNEVCALSGHNISPGTKVRLLFLTQNPYINSDQKNAQRGCYPTDQWFVRTPPISGTYDDYGRCKFKEGPITKLICDVFQEDVVERPFGFNQYHAGDVTKTKGIHHFLNAASQGRLLVKDKYPCSFIDKIPSHYPTWQIVQGILKTNKLPIQSESKVDEGKAGYNAQPIIPGVVCVTFNSYDDTTKKLEKAQKFLGEIYDCKIVSQHNNVCLWVAPKGAYENPNLLFDQEQIKAVLNEYPGNAIRKCRELPVLAVMVREDVWQAYCTVVADPKYPQPFNFGDRPTTVESFYEKFKEATECSENQSMALIKLDLMGISSSIPFMIMANSHIVKALSDKFTAMEELLRSCAELARVEYVMGHLSLSWNIPSLGGQDGNWALRTALFHKLTDICQKELDEVMAEWGNNQNGQGSFMDNFVHFPSGGGGGGGSTPSAIAGNGMEPE